MHTFSDIDEKIAFCFQPPSFTLDEHRRNGTVSVLYLLRRELLETAGRDPGTEPETIIRSEGTRKRLFTSMILSFTMVDLLAKFALGDGGHVGDRFKDFLQHPQLGALNEQVATLFYAVRNSLVHSFGVPDAASLSKLGLTAVGYVQRRVTPYAGVGDALHVAEQDGLSKTAIVCVDGACATAIDAVGRTKDRLHGSDSGSARPLFDQMFEKYGRIEMP
jgi:hypothetical protein